MTARGEVIHDPEKKNKPNFDRWSNEVVVAHRSGACAAHNGCMREKQNRVLAHQDSLQALLVKTVKIMGIGSISIFHLSKL